MAEKESQAEQQKLDQQTGRTRTVSTISTYEGNQFERVSLADAIKRLTEIVKANESKVENAFKNAPDWQARAKMSMSTFRQTAEGAEGKKELHTIIKIPATFSKEQRDVLKEYAKQLGGTYTNMKVVTTQADGTQKQSFPAQIEFKKGNAYSADICAKIILGSEADKIIADLTNRQKLSEERKQAQAQAQVQEAKAETKKEKIEQPKPKKSKGQSI